MRDVQREDPERYGEWAFVLGLQQQRGSEQAQTGSWWEGSMSSQGSHPGKGRGTGAPASMAQSQTV